MGDKKVTILIVDDEPVIRNILNRKLLSEGYTCREASGAVQAMEQIKKESIGLVLLDIRMPGKSGIELLAELEAHYPDIGVIMATASGDTDTAVQCLRAGAYDYITKPFDLDRVVAAVNQALEKRSFEIDSRRHRLNLEQTVVDRTLELRGAIQKIKSTSLDTIYRLSLAAEYKDTDTGAHIKRMGQYCASIARRLGLSGRDMENILYAAPPHDIGKIGVPDIILRKPGRLDEKEREIMKRHTILGAQLLEGSDIEFVQLAEVIALTHHEKWDGSGYPGGLKGSDIPLAGRITAIADVFDALISRRPYKEPIPIEKSFSIVKEGRASHFDPDVLDAFLEAKDDILSIELTYRNEDDSQLVKHLLDSTAGELRIGER